jgi:glyoxylase-like metal-dependent hydrolase (beta-lactamase superfamily II)
MAKLSCWQDSPQHKLNHDPFTQFINLHRQCVLSVADFNIIIMHNTRTAEKPTTAKIHCPFESPRTGQPVEVGEGIWWIRLPLSSHIDHVNVYLLEDSSGWVLVDTGSDSPKCREILQNVLSSKPFASKPVERVIATHYHPDHIGLAGWFAARGAHLLATRTCWLTARGLHFQSSEVPRDEQLMFMRRAGMSELELAAYQRRRISSYASLVSPLPTQYESITEGDVLELGGRQWKIHLGHGHAAGHATMWTHGEFAIVGDQIISGISPNISVHPSEPHADLTTEWLASCEKFRDLP